MPRQALEVADIFRLHGPAWRREQAGHLSLGQLKVMSAIEQCRTAALGGHVECCQACGYTSTNARTMAVNITTPRKISINITLFYSCLQINATE